MTPLWQALFIPILKVEKLRFKEVKWLGQDHIHVKGQIWVTHLNLLALAPDHFYPPRLSLMWITKIRLCSLCPSSLLLFSIYALGRHACIRILSVQGEKSQARAINPYSTKHKWENHHNCTIHNTKGIPLPTLKSPSMRQLGKCPNSLRHDNFRSGTQRPPQMI